jgi:hypothetical protein
MHEGDRNGQWAAVALDCDELSRIAKPQAAIGVSFEIGLDVYASYKGSNVDQPFEARVGRRLLTFVGRLFYYTADGAFRAPFAPPTESRLRDSVRPDG